MTVVLRSALFLLAMWRLTEGIVNPGQLFFRAFVSKSRLDSQSLRFAQKTDIGKLSSFIQAVNRCHRESWCTCLCQYPGKSFIMTNLVVTGGVVDPQGVPIVRCFTKRPPALFPSSSNVARLSSSLSEMTYGAAREKENMADGIYDYDFDHCFKTDYSSLPYFLVDLGSVYKISRVVVRVQEDGTSTNFENIYVAIGNSSTNGTFTFYDSFAFQVDPTLAPDTDVVFYPEEPKYGQFLGILKNNTYSYMQFCHLEIY